MCVCSRVVDTRYVPAHVRVERKENSSLTAPPLPLLPPFLILFSGDVVDFVRAYSAVLREHYPERSRRIIFINTPFFFSAMWRVALQFIDPATVEKTSIIRYSGTAAVKAELSKFIDPEWIPLRYGGESAQGATALGTSPQETSVRAYVASLATAGAVATSSRRQQGGEGEASPPQEEADRLSFSGGAEAEVGAGAGAGAGEQELLQAEPAPLATASEAGNTPMAAAPVAWAGATDADTSAGVLEQAPDDDARLRAASAAVVDDAWLRRASATLDVEFVTDFHKQGSR